MFFILIFYSKKLIDTSTIVTDFSIFQPYNGAENQTFKVTVTYKSDITPFMLDVPHTYDSLSSPKPEIMFTMHFKDEKVF